MLTLFEGIILVCFLLKKKKKKKKLLLISPSSSPVYDLFLCSTIPSSSSFYISFSPTVTVALYVSFKFQNINAAQPVSAVYALCRM